MKYAALDAFGLDDMEFRERDIPAPGPGEVLIKVAACSINYRDFMIANGLYKTDIPMPLIPLSDCSGTVEAVGERVSSVSAGDRITSVLWQDWESGALSAGQRTASPGCETPGVLAEYALLPETGVAAMPGSLSFAEAACLPAAGLTAFASLTTVGGLQAGGTVLTLGTGGVSLFALQFAKAMGATVAITSGSDEKLGKAAALGADILINYNSTPDWGEEVLRQTGGADVVVETAGAGTLAQSMAAVGFSGRIAYLGALSGFSAETNLMPLVVKNASIHGVTVSHREDHRRMTAFVDEHGIKPVIDTVYPFAQGIQAIKDIAAGRHFGKLAVEVV